MADRRYQDEPVHVETYQTYPGTPVRRISWGAVLAGTLIAIMVLLLINLVLLGTGLQTIDPASEADPLSGVGTGAAVGVIIANVVALFFGGWVAGRLAGNPRTFEGALHGILTWGLLTLLSFWLLSTAVGRLVSGVTSAVGQGLSAVAQGVSALAPDAAQAVQDALEAQGVSLQNIRQEAQQLVNQAGTDQNLQGQAQGAAQEAQNTAAEVAQNPQQASQEINQLLDQLAAQGENIADSANRQDLVEALARSTNLSQEEAEQTVDNWTQTLQGAQAEVQQVQQELETAAQNATDAVGRAALWAFVGLLVGAIIAAIGGAVGSPRSPAAARRA